MSTAGGQGVTGKAGVSPASSPAAPGVMAELARVPASVWAMVGVVGLAFVGLYFRWIYRQGEHSVASLEDWGHAFVVPALSLYLIWRDRRAILSTPVKPFWPGLAPLLLGVMCYFFFIAGVSNHLGQGLALLLTLAGVALVLGGSGLFRYFFLPIAVLLFAITLPEQVMNLVTFRLQLIASDGATVLLSLIALPGSWFQISQSGNVLTVFYKGQEHPLNVAEACSGMRMVIAFVALSGAVAILSCKHWWQRVAVMLIAPVVAIVVNVIRVAILGLLTLVDPDLAAGNAHILIGTILLIPALLVFLALVEVLKRLVVEDAPAKEGGA